MESEYIIFLSSTVELKKIFLNTRVEIKITFKSCGYFYFVVYFVSWKVFVLFIYFFETVLLQS